MIIGLDLSEDDVPVIQQANPPQPQPEVQVVEINIDASSLKMLQCPAKFSLRVVEGLVRVEESEFLSTGKAVHKLVEHIENGMPRAKALATVMLECKAPQNIGTIMDKYRSENYPRPYIFRGKPMIEFFFKVHFADIIHGKRVFRVYFCGTLDRVCKEPENVLIIDTKTSRKRDDSAVFDAYEHSVQFYFYQWALRKFARQIFAGDDAMIKLCEANSIVTKILACKVYDGRWLLGPARNHPVERLAVFERTLTYIVDKLIQWHVDYYAALDDGRAWAPAKLGMVNEACSYCDYPAICHETDPERCKMILESMYKVDKYNPAHF